jgi:hypothetical protein
MSGIDIQNMKVFKEKHFKNAKNLTFLINPIYLKGCFRNGFAIEKTADLMKNFEMMVKVS